MLVLGSGMMLVAIRSLRSAGKRRRISAKSCRLSSAVECALKPPRTNVSPSSPPSSFQSLLPWFGVGVLPFAGLFGGGGEVVFPTVASVFRSCQLFVWFLPPT